MLVVALALWFKAICDAIMKGATSYRLKPIPKTVKPKEVPMVE